LVQWPSAHSTINVTGTSFVEAAKQPVLSAGLQLATNVRVMASEAPFLTVETLVEDMVRMFARSRCAYTIRSMRLCRSVDGHLQNLYYVVHIIPYFASRDESENLMKRRILEMDLKLLQSENAMLDESIRASVGMLLTLASNA
jgi:hypothetical protein